MKTILIVDDTFENLYLLRVILEEVGYIVVEAKDGKEGLDKLHEYDVDLIISDILMPVMDGYLFCQACKKDEQFKNIPFVFYTSTYTEALDEDFALKLGAVQFLRKPTDQNKILSVIRDVFAKSKPGEKVAKNIKFTEEEVLKLYSKRLISKLEQKNLDLESEVLEREKTQRLLIHKNEILDLIAVNTPLHEIFDRLILNYQSIYPSYYGSISLVDPDGIHLNLESSPSLPETYSLAVRRVPIGENVGSCGTAAFTGKPVIVSDIGTDALWINYKDIALESDLKSCWSIPILSKNKTVIGTFAIYSKSISAPSLKDIRELNFTLNLVNIAIEKSRIVEEIKKKDESYKALIDQATDSIITYSLDGTIHSFNKAVYTNLGYTEEEFLKLNINDLNQGNFIKSKENYESLLNGESILFFRKFKRKDGSFIETEVSARMQKDGEILSIARDLTERKNAEFKLLESEHNLKQAQIIGNIGSYSLDLNTQIWEGSIVLNKMLGINKSFEKTFESWMSLIHPDEREEVRNHFEDCILNNKKFDKEYRIIKLDDKKEIWTHGIGEFVFDSDAKPIKIIGTMQDITSRKHAEIKIQESEYNLRQSQIVGNIGSYVIDLNELTWEGSAFLFSVFGINKDYTRTMEGWTELIHPDHKEEVSNYFEYCVINNKKFNKEYKVLKQGSKEEVWVHGIGKLIFDGKDNPTKMIGTIQDITQRKNIELDLKKANEFSTSLLDGMHEGLVAINLESEIISVNPSFCKMTGFTEQELIGVKRPFPYSPPELKKENDARYKLLTENRNKKDYENTYMRKNGERFPVHVLISSVYDANGVKTANFSTVQDITDRKKAEIDLKLAKDFSENLILNLNEGLSVVNMDGVQIEANPALCKMLRFTKEELVGQKAPFNYWPPEKRKEIEETYANILKGEYSKVELTLMRKNGERFPVLMSASFVKNNEGEIIANIATIQDISQRKQAERRLQENEKSLLEAQKIAKIGSYRLNLKTQKIEASATFEKILELDDNREFFFEAWEEIIHPDDALLDKEMFSKSIETGEAFDLEFRVITKNKKQLKWIHALGQVIHYNNEPVEFFGTIQDITERKHSEIKIKESEKSLLEAQKIAKTGSFNLSLKNLVAETSATFKEVIGIDKDALVDFEIWKAIVYSEDRSIVKETVLECQEHNKNFDLEYRILTKDTKELKWIHGLGEIISIKGKAIGFVGTIQDITARKKAAIDLKIANEFTENLVMSMQEGLLMVDLEGTIMKVNDSLCEILGYSEEELIGQELPYPFAQEKDYENMLKIKGEVAKGDALSFQLEFVKKSGNKFIASFLTGIIKNDEGKVVAIFATIKDVSEEEKIRKALEDIAIKSKQKKDVILELASLIGEDFDSSLKKIAIESAKALDVDLVTIWEYRNEQTELVSRLFYNTTGNVFKSNELTIAKDSFPNYFNAFKSRNSINIRDVKSNPITKDFAKQFFIPNNISSRIDVLIHGRNNYYGIISFESKLNNRAFSVDEESFVTSIASIVSLMIESTERKTAENKIAITNQKLTEVNKELNTLKEQLEQENVYLRNELDLVFNYEEMVYGSVEFSNVLTEVEKVAPTTATVLLLGESGTGKELLARAVHNTSLRNNKPLIKVNCSAIPRELIESELFGHKKGSFTGAISDKVGKFELANGGTLFLDEIGELPLDMQPKILRFLQEGEIEVVGGVTGLKKLDVRVIAATNRDLKEEIKKKQFREDLYFRLNVFPIEVPPLRDRKDDVPLLVEHFVDKFNKAYGKNIKYITDDAMSKLKAYNWPGNIRELENLIERASILSNTETLVVPGFESSTQKAKPINGKDLTLDSVQRNHIIMVLEQCSWKISGPKGAAVVLNLKPSTLRDRMTKLNILKPK
ncbi:PAS domain S-box protein [uncultured Lacinutrix sp.]|uniref:PAS domain S-box protein n=1 Tax=uncultured Lacinutrix sp. TaxID=574032 RepID=UPI00260DB12A|nr:PAS domain S-box protein [uncultured Lacinutrix sp.]